jgi:hypothetical protein
VQAPPLSQVNTGQTTPQLAQLEAITINTVLKANTHIPTGSTVVVIRLQVHARAITVRWAG